MAEQQKFASPLKAIVDGMLNPWITGFNSLVFIESSQFTIRRNVEKKVARYGFIISFAILIFLLILDRYQKRFILFILQIIFVSIVLYSSEIVILNALLKYFDKNLFGHVFLIFDILWWVFPAIYLCKGIDQFIWTPLENKTNQEIPQLVRHCISIIVYLIFFFCIIAFVFDKKVTSLLASTGVIAMIIGLAVQINISNIFSGIALAMEKSFSLDDWVKVGNYDEAKVIGMNWRTTQFRKRDNTTMLIPNSEVGNASIINYQQDGNRYELLIRIHVDPVHEPERVIKIVLDALNTSPYVLKENKPLCRFTGYTEWSGEYVAIAILKDYAMKKIQKGEIVKHIWKELHRTGIKQAINIREIHVIRGEKKRGAKRTDILSFIKGVDIFRDLPKEAKLYLSQCLSYRHYKPGETIVKDGDVGNSLFIIVEGFVSVMVKAGGGEYIETNRIGAGNYFGEMALLRGSPRTANIIAISSTVVCEITQEDIAKFVEKRPEIKTAFNKNLTQRIKENKTKIKEHRVVKQKQKKSNQEFHKKIMKFFGIRESIK